MYNIIKLENGLRVVIEKIDYVNSVSVGLFVGNGSRNEESYNNGISHFIEHILFKGTNKRNAKEIAECIENVGGQINAFTGKEATCFYIKALNTHLELSLDIISDMILNSKLDPEDIEREKGVIVEEINMNEDSPEDVLLDLHCKAAFENDSLSLPILGNSTTVKNITKTQLLDFMHKYYVPDNAVLSICGNFNENSIEKLVQKYFSQWKNESLKSNLNYKNVPIQKNHFFRKKSIEQLHISLGFKGLPIGDEEIYPLFIVSNVLGGGASSILFQKIREEKGLCYSIYVNTLSYMKAGLVYIYTGLNPKYAFDVVKLIKEEIDKFIKEGITEERLYKAKEQLKGNYILGLESTSSRMFSNGKSILMLNRLNTPDNIIKKIDRVNSSSIKKIMEKIFKPGIQNSAFVGNGLDMELMMDFMEGEKVAYKNKESSRV